MEKVSLKGRDLLDRFATDVAIFDPKIPRTMFAACGISGGKKGGNGSIVPGRTVRTKNLQREVDVSVSGLTAAGNWKEKGKKKKLRRL